MTLNEFAPSRPANPTGFYEDIDLVWLLSGTDIIQPDSIDDLPQWQALVAVAIESLKSGIAARCVPGVDWGAKSYQLIRNLPTVISALADNNTSLKVIQTVRPTADSITSWNRVLSGGEWIADFADTAASEVSGLTVPVLSVDYAEMLADPTVAVAVIAEFVGKSSNQSAIDFIDPSLRSV